MNITFARDSELKYIAEGAFAGCKFLTKIRFPATLENLGDGCFGKPKDPVERGDNRRQRRQRGKLSDPCSSLFRVTFENGSVIRRIGKKVFQNCVSLEHIELPSSVHEIGDECFANSGLSSITLARWNMEHIGSDAFNGCNLSEITIPASIEVLRDRSIFGRVPISRVIFAKGSHLKELDCGVFNKCHNLKEIVIGRRLEKLNIETLSDKVVLRCHDDNDDRATCYMKDNHLVHIPSKTLIWGHRNIREVNIPVEIEFIGDNCFQFASMSCVIFPPGCRVKGIGKRAFYGCSNLTSFEIPASVSEIGTSAFCKCDITNFSIAADNQHFQVINQCLILHIESKSVIGWFREISSIEIPAFVEAIGDDCFEDNHVLSTLTFEDGSCLKHIGRCAFSSCSRLNEFEIPIGIEQSTMLSSCGHTFNRLTFASNTQIKRIDNMRLPAREIEIPASVEEISKRVFQNDQSIRRLIFPSDSRLRRLEERAFESSSIKEINIPASVEYIGKRCFMDTLLAQVRFDRGSNLKIIDDYVFSSCHLNSIEIPASVEEIGEASLRTLSLTSVTFEAGSQLKRIKANSFPHTLNVTLPDGVEIIPSHENVPEQPVHKKRASRTQERRNAGTHMRVARLVLPE